LLFFLSGANSLSQVLISYFDERVPLLFGGFWCLFLVVFLGLDDFLLFFEELLLVVHFFHMNIVLLFLFHLKFEGVSLVKFVLLAATA